MKLSIGLIIFLTFFRVLAQEPPPSTSDSGIEPPIEAPLGRVKSTTEPNNESSSFMPDPDNLDPLDPNRENIKEDDEPVLDDIKQVLDAPVPSATDASADQSESEAEKSAQAEKKKKKLRNPDDPDLVLEKKFHNLYNRYNKNPTPDDVWQAASSKQTARQYTVQKGDTLWSISKILFGDPNFWPKLWALNKQGILNPHFIKPKTTIYFYSGDSENSPTLSVGEDVRQDDGQGSPPQLSQSGPSEKAAAIPDSIPLYRSEKYFNPQTRDVKINFQTLPDLPTNITNNIVITDSPLPSSVSVQISEIIRYRCYEGRILKDLTYSGNLLPAYDVYAPLDPFKTPNGDYYAYKYYGGAEIFENVNLRLTGCRDLIATNLVFIPKGDIQKYRSNKITPSQIATLVGGPDVYSQALFNINSKAYVDFGSHDFEPGQEYKVLSNLTEQVNGQVKIIEKYGSMAVVQVTEINDTMEIGDKIVF